MTWFPLEDPGMFDCIFDTLHITRINVNRVNIGFRLWSNSADVCGGSFCFDVHEWKVFPLWEA